LFPLKRRRCRTPRRLRRSERAIAGSGCRTRSGKFTRIVENKFPYDDVEIISSGLRPYRGPKDYCEKSAALLTLASRACRQFGPVRTDAWRIADWISTLQGALLRKMLRWEHPPPEGVSDGRPPASPLGSNRLGQQRYVESLDAYCKQNQRAPAETRRNIREDPSERLTPRKKSAITCAVFYELPGAGST